MGERLILRGDEELEEVRWDEVSTSEAFVGGDDANGDDFCGEVSLAFENW